jgi:hypothetical protein
MNPLRAVSVLAHYTSFRVSQHSPLGENRNDLCLIKTPKNPVEKKKKREHSATRCIALVASLKTIGEKLQENSQWEKEYNRCL